MTAATCSRAARRASGSTNAMKKNTSVSGVLRSHLGVDRRGRCAARRPARSASPRRAMPSGSAEEHRERRAAAASCRSPAVERQVLDDASMGSFLVARCGSGPASIAGPAPSISSGRRSAARESSAPRPRSPRTAAAHVPSSNASSSTSLIHMRKSVSSFFRPMPYGSSVNGSPTTLNSPGFWSARPARITLSVVTATTCPLRSGSRQLRVGVGGHQDGAVLVEMRGRGRARRPSRPADRRGRPDR